VVLRIARSRLRVGLGTGEVIAQLLAHQLVDARGRLAHISRPHQGDEARAEATRERLSIMRAPADLGFDTLNSDSLTRHPLVECSSPPECLHAPST